MQRDAWYYREDIVKTYESWYEGKYKRADVLEKTLLRKLLDALPETRSLLEVGKCSTSRGFACQGRIF